MTNDRLPASLTSGPFPSLPSTLDNYFDYSSGAYGTPPAPAKKFSGPWASLLDMMFLTTSITPDPTRANLFTQNVQFADPNTEAWVILPNAMYSVRAMTMKTVGYSPLEPGVVPAPTNLLKGQVTLGTQPDVVTVPLDESTTWVHDVSKLTIGDLLDFFGAMRPDVGKLASTTLPCPIAATASLVIGAVNAGGPPQIEVDYGDTPQVSCTLKLTAVDPIEGGTLQSVTIFARNLAEWQIVLSFDYLGAPFIAKYPYLEIDCAPSKPPITGTPTPILIRIISGLITALLVTAGRILAWRSICTYTSKWFPDLSSKSLDGIASDVAAAAAEANTSLTLADLGSGMWQAFTPELQDADTLAEALKASDLPGADSPAQMASALHTANPGYTAGAVAGALDKTYQAGAIVIAQALVATFGYAADQAGANAVVGALVQGNVSTDPVALGGATRQVFPDVTPSMVAVALCAALGREALGPVTVAKALQNVFPPAQPQALGSGSLAGALAAAGFNPREAGQGLHTVFPETCAAYVTDLMTAFIAIAQRPGAIDVAFACAGSDYALFDALAAMTGAPGSYFDAATADAALKQAYTTIPNSLRLNGGSMTVAPSPINAPGGAFSFTIEVELIPGNSVSVGQKGPAPPQHMPRGFDFSLDSGGSGAGFLSFTKFDQNGFITTQFSWQATASLFDDLPHTLAAVYFGSGVTLYLDGVELQQSSSAGGGTPDMSISNPGPLVVGGAVDCMVLAVRLWSRLLSADQLKNNLSQPPDPGATIGFWDFHDGSTSDQSPLHNTGTLGGGAVIGPVF